MTWKETLNKKMCMRSYKNKNLLKTINDLILSMEYAKNQ